MPQTLQAFLAMFIVTLLSINQQQSVLRSYDVMLDQATEVMSSGVALQCLDFISNMAFDAELLTGFATSPSDLTASPFTTGNNCNLDGPGGPCNDVDDFHYMTPDTLTFIGRDGQTQRFAVTAEVHYVDQDLNPDSTVTYQTYEKMVMVQVEDINNVMSNPVRISRLITCDASMGCN